jgi:hypothetical protein
MRVGDHTHIIFRYFWVITCLICGHSFLCVGGGGAKVTPIRTDLDLFQKEEYHVLGCKKAEAFFFLFALSSLFT